MRAKQHQFQQQYTSIAPWRLLTRGGGCGWTAAALCVILLFAVLATSSLFHTAGDDGDALGPPVLHKGASASATASSQTLMQTGGSSTKQHQRQGQGRCDLFSGRWIYDQNSSSHPLYSEKGCGFMNGIVACKKFGRKDLQYQKWRWQPYGCNLPRFNATALLEKLRGKRLVFVGDSLNWNQWVSLICLVESAVPRSQKTIQPHGPLKTFHLKEYNTSIDNYWAPLLVESNSDDPIHCELPDRIIRPESIKKHAVHWMNADVLIFNSYLWWRKSKLKVLWGLFNESHGIYKEIDALRSFELALRTWADWLEFNVDRSKTKIFFMALSPTHFWVLVNPDPECNYCITWLCTKGFFVSFNWVGAGVICLHRSECPGHRCCRRSLKTGGNDKNGNRLLYRRSPVGFAGPISSGTRALRHHPPDLAQQYLHRNGEAEFQGAGSPAASLHGVEKNGCSCQLAGM